jgi:ferredoxin
MVRGTPTGDLRRPSVKIVVDRVKCIGAANCVGMAPGTFKLDPEKKAMVVRPDAHDDNTLFEAAESCPTEAIALYDDTGEQIFP